MKLPSGLVEEGPAGVRVVRKRRVEVLKWVSWMWRDVCGARGRGRENERGLRVGEPIASGGTVAGNDSGSIITRYVEVEDYVECGSGL